MSDDPREVAYDEYYTPEIKPHSIEKIRLHNRYAGLFSTAMHRKWPQRAYVGLYSGPGHAQLARTNRTLETSALGVLRLPHRFTHYIYVDQDERCVQALQARSLPLRTGVEPTIIHADVNECAEQVRQSLPSFSKNRGLLSFCFVDPFDLGIRFDTIRELGKLKMDFLVLLMLGVDGRRNFQQYLDDSTSTRIGDLIDSPDWRTAYLPHVKPIRFLLTRFDEAMQRIGYLSATDDLHPIRIAGMGVLQYVLAFYSKDELGQRFWRDTRSTLSSQLSLL